ncbi:MAG: acyl carrier protein [Pyrinomonadaceae bacterium]
MTGSAENHLYRTISEVLGIVPEALSEESSPETIASWDSLNHLNLVMALESEFKIALPVEDALQMRNVTLIQTILRMHGVKV